MSTNPGAAVPPDITDTATSLGAMIMAGSIVESNLRVMAAAIDGRSDAVQDISGRTVEQLIEKIKTDAASRSDLSPEAQDELKTIVSDAKHAISRRNHYGHAIWTVGPGNVLMALRSRINRTEFDAEKVLNLTRMDKITNELTHVSTRIWRWCIGNVRMALDSVDGGPGGLPWEDGEALLSGAVAVLASAIDAVADGKTKMPNTLLKPRLVLDPQSAVTPPIL